MVKTTATAKKTSATKSKTKKTTPVKKVKSVTVANTDVDEEISTELFFKLWLEGWKKTFTLRGRASRFELWSFLTVNTVIICFLRSIATYFLSPAFLRNANLSGYSLSMIDGIVLTAETLIYLSIFIPLFPLGSLMIRRLHDTGRLAWKKFIEPICMGTVVLWVLSYTLDILEEWEWAEPALLVAICFICMLYGAIYYTLKFVVIALFYTGDKEQNLYGLPKYNSELHEEVALKLTCLYILFAATVTLFSLALISI